MPIMNGYEVINAITNNPDALRSVTGAFCRAHRSAYSMGLESPPMTDPQWEHFANWIRNSISMTGPDPSVGHFSCALDIAEELPE